MDFSREPAHSDQLQVRKAHPWNAEPDVATLVEHPLTPEHLVYCRNHCPVEALDGSTFKITIDGLVQHAQAYTLADLAAQFPKKEIVAALQCAGNRRKTMQDRKHHDVEGVLWEEGTICNCRWAGVSMRELLLRAGAPAVAVGKKGEEQRMQSLHLCFASHAPCEDEDWFGASIPLAKVLDEEGDVLVAYEMNGRPLSPDHGYPFRVVVPGYTGARWVKWVDHISVAERESENFYQQRDYKVLPTKADKEDWWSKVPPILANPLNSVVAVVQFEPPRTLFVKGYAVRGPSGQVSRVEVSIDEGTTWRGTRITYQEGRWSWTLWEAVIGLPETYQGREGKIRSRAIDESGETQQPDMDWNLRGVSYSAVGEKEFRT
ncbi:predicted protein [Postia placenta Mad-698-R]|uniref:Sulfite oxidase n=1 Tax=Postia placenta MAD-698-R-SB12 TaxID=670580 RepID=A0A1X6MN04_9APHY|nr:hypothetical protein POSPLADRAFT_1050003 [Postia placenta MAD-698-R-SB12]EED84273.1 predicted protein [Postia placenta Mad-698-R]OSX57817.1 hypothetical protein POSPLADRAFT_1050003 [Postia placenta MAD-698-R-SB12]